MRFIFFIPENIDSTIFWSLIFEPVKDNFQQSRGKDYVLFLVASLLYSLQTIPTSPVIKNSGRANATGHTVFPHQYQTVLLC